MLHNIFEYNQLGHLSIEIHKISVKYAGYLGIPHVVIEGQHEFDILMARWREGIFFSEKNSEVHVVFVIMGTRDQRNFHLHALSAIAQTIRDPRFEAKWAAAKTRESLRDLLLLGERRRLPAGQ